MRNNRQVFRNDTTDMFNRGYAWIDKGNVLR